MYPERDGRMGSFGDQDFARSLMEAFTDPARHARMMHAAQAEYLLMVADNLGSDRDHSHIMSARVIEFCIAFPIVSSILRY